MGLGLGLSSGCFDLVRDRTPPGQGPGPGSVQILSRFCPGSAGVARALAIRVEPPTRTSSSTWVGRISTRPRTCRSKRGWRGEEPVQRGPPSDPSGPPPPPSQPSLPSLPPLPPLTPLPPLLPLPPLPLPLPPLPLPPLPHLPPLPSLPPRACGGGRRAFRTGASALSKSSAVTFSYSARVITIGPAAWSEGGSCTSTVAPSSPS